MPETANEERIETLEIKLSYQEEFIQTLSDELYHQQQRIDRLENHYRVLTERFTELKEAGASGAQDEVPPHY